MMRVVVLVLLLVFPHFATAQGAATLVADNVTLNGQDQLIATGNVEVFFEENRLSAHQIIYDQRTDTLEISGPVFIKTADGTILTADRATLDPRLENGILQGARLVLAQQLQLVANQIDRREGRYAQLYKTAATSCRVCGTRPPLWEIRAERVVHDQRERQLYFDNATFRVRGVPVFWLPRMRLPDPTLERATGFLIPNQRNTTQLGTGIKIPYFIKLGDSRDITVTPYVSSETRTLELVYRQAFVRGTIALKGAASQDTLLDETRSYLFADGMFDLGADYKLRFGIEAVSDPAYLLDYGYSDKDRLESGITVFRVTDDTFSQARFLYFQTLRDGESNASLPPIIADIRHETRWASDLGGIIALNTSLDTAYRYSTIDGDAGRDVTRAGVEGTWKQHWIMQSGLIADGQIGLRGDLYFTNDDSRFAAQDQRIVPSAGLTLRWPLARQAQGGTSNLLEPTVSLGWADTYGGPTPNEDSTRTELDRANLFAISRYAGDDAVETGLQGAAGLTWTRFGNAGVTSTLSFGRVLRAQAQDGFTESSGLEGTQSDWLLSGQLIVPGGFLFDGRSLWDDNSGLTVADSRIAWRNDAVSLAAAYIWQAADPAEDRPGTISEWTFDASFDLNQSWRLGLDGRYDVAADRPVRGGIGLQWRNECVTIDVSASRRYTSSSTVEPTTTYGLSGTIGSFSAGRATGGIAASCGN